MFVVYSVTLNVVNISHLLVWLIYNSLHIVSLQALFTPTVWLAVRWVSTSRQATGKSPATTAKRPGATTEGTEGKLQFTIWTAYRCVYVVLVCCNFAEFQQLIYGFYCYDVYVSTMWISSWVIYLFIL